jgi:lipopolysaccharide transport system permease protein
VAVFSFIFHADPPSRLNLIVGLFLWDFFAESTKTGLVSLHSKGFLLAKARFPRWIVVVTSISNPLITLGGFAIVLIAFLAATGRAPSAPAAGLAFLYVAALVAICVGFSLASSVMFLRYRDLNQVWEVVSQAGFFLAPIIWPLGTVPERFHAYLYLWPPTPIIEFVRAVLVEGTVPTLRAHLYLGCGAAVTLLVGLLIFHRLAPRAAEYL